ncbi:MAG: hypothetical protein JWQ78_526 [Sediminibacterium sp.]|jgi:hypothetical protein|nr:hypothetical protein [Sediminibacterium sp.]
MANVLVQWLVTGLVSLMHPFFVSVIEINHNPKEAAMEISVRIFTEDLEKTLQKYSTGKVDILNPADKALLEKQISQYITQKLKLKINGQPVTLQYIGHEIQQESVWSFFEVNKITEAKNVQVDCNLLYDLVNSQTNIFHVKSKGVEKSYKLDFPASSAVFAF